MTMARPFPLSYLCLAILAAACGAPASGRETPQQPPTMSPAGPPASRGGQPVPCGLWRLADPGQQTDEYAFLPTVEMEDIALAGPPIAWSRIHGVQIVEIPWVKGSNRVVEFAIEGLVPERAGDRLLIVNDRQALYAIKPAKTRGLWRIEGSFTEDELPRVERILAGRTECGRLDDPGTAP